MRPQVSRALVLLAVCAASPVALGLDAIARRFVVASQPDDVRQFLSDEVTRLAWYFVPGPALGGVLGFALYPRFFRRALARNRGGPLPDPERRADLEALFVATTLAQIPALVGDLFVLLGGRWAPAICSASICLAAVTTIGLFAGRDMRARAASD